MFDVRARINEFYHSHIRLGEAGRKILAGHRDTNLDRLRDGLKKLGDAAGKTYPSYLLKYDQGSYAMHTLNKHEDNDYDIDVGVLFDESALPASALDSRKRIADAIKEKADGFAKDPEARTNAVTVWYAAGHHVDFAIYRKRVEHGLEIIEHAGADWVARDPTEMNDWFDERVSTLSPDKKNGATVEPGQLRKVVRFVKAFCRSRTGWKLPGGMIITSLVVPAYQRDFNRDDVALYNTLAEVQRRLRLSLDVFSPLAGRPCLTAAPPRKSEAKRLLAKLDSNLPKLAPLLDAKCTAASANDAWNRIFNHNFWTTQVTKATLRDAAGGRLERFDLSVGVASFEGGSVHFEYKDKPLPKGLWLKFSAANVPVALPYEIRWAVENEGDEAEDDHGLKHETIAPPGQPHWESTKYMGRHKMTCEIMKDGAAVAREVRTIKIGER